MQWRPILDGHYIVSETGIVQRAKGKTAGRIIKASPDGHGYLKTSLCVHGHEMTKPVHVLVALAFLGERPAGMYVNHIDGNKRNNHRSNLEYTTPRGNSEHAARIGLVASGARHGRSTKPHRTARGESVNTARLSVDQVREIRALWDNGSSLSEIVARFGLSKSATHAVCVRKNWRHVA